MSTQTIKNCSGQPVTLKQKHIVMGGRVFDINCAACRRFEPWKKTDSTWLAPAMQKGECQNRIIELKD